MASDIITRVLPTAGDDEQVGSFVEPGANEAPRGTGRPGAPLTAADPGLAPTHAPQPARDAGEEPGSGLVGSGDVSAVDVRPEPGGTGSVVSVEHASDPSKMFHVRPCPLCGLPHGRNKPGETRPPRRDGLCPWCDGPREPGRRVCGTCHATYMRGHRKKHRQLALYQLLLARCRAYTNVLIRRGKLKRGHCAVCQYPRTIAFHEDVHNPRVVLWLCPAHHRVRTLERRAQLILASSEGASPEGDRHG